jgi:hypothetical protein
VPDTKTDDAVAADVDHSKPIGALLDLGGAPLSPHTCVGVRGQYRPDRPTPLGGEGEVTVAEVQAGIAAGAHLKLVNIPKAKIDELRALAAEDLAAARRGAVLSRQDGLVGAEAALNSEHLNAVKEI